MNMQRSRPSSRAHGSLSFRIGHRSLGPSRPAYIVAEMSANHGGSLRRALRILKAAKKAGADAVKLQTYTADTMTIDSSRAPFRIRGTPWHGRRLYDLYCEASTPWEWYPRLKREALRLGLDLFSTAFDPSSVDFLERQGVPIHKIASFEIVDLPLIEKAARTGKPLILSTGMATLAEIQDAVRTARRAGAREILLLKCTSAYPAPPEEMNLRAIPRLARKFRVPVGLSDHSLGIAVPIATVSIGACLIEKHFTLSRRIRTPDSAFSMEPGEFKAMVEAVRAAEAALVGERIGPGPSEKRSLVFRRSLFAVRAIREGEAFTANNVRSVRPGFGLSPNHLSRILGRKALRDIGTGMPLHWDLVGEGK